MKLNGVKTIIAVALALLLAFICEIIAPEADSRNWISLGVAFVTIVAMLIPAIGIKFENPRRGANIKVLSWVFALGILIANIVFACFEYRVDIYIVVVALITVIGWGLIYALFSAKE